METWHVIIVVGLVIAGGMIALPMLNDDKDDEPKTPTFTTFENKYPTYRKLAAEDMREVNNYRLLYQFWSSNLLLGIDCNGTVINYYTNYTSSEYINGERIDTIEYVDLEDGSLGMRLKIGSGYVEIIVAAFVVDTSGDWMYAKGLCYLAKGTDTTNMKVIGAESQNPNYGRKIGVSTVSTSSDKETHIELTLNSYSMIQLPKKISIENK